MKVLLDECVDARFASHIQGFETSTVHDLGWSGITNGKLLSLAAEQFDVFVTVDRNLSFQQHLPKFDIAVVLIHCRSNRLNELLEFLPDLAATLPNAKPGTLTHVGL
ncbi:MAG: DUF5615 family PIN-like protein [Steroidobacteraceae bacterium]